MSVPSMRAQAVMPEAHELWAVFLCGGLVGVVLYRLWTMLATSLSYYGYRLSFPKVTTPPTSRRPAVSKASVDVPVAQAGLGTGGSGVSVVVNRAPSASQTGVIQVQVAADVAAPGKTFSFEMDPHAVAGHAADAPVKISQMDGKPLPNWLRYDAANKTFTANEVPAGAFPLQLKVAVGNTESVMVIQEKPPGK